MRISDWSSDVCSSDLQRQACLFATGERFDLLHRTVAAEVEAAEEVAQRLLAGAWIDTTQMQHCRSLRIEAVGRVLREIADAQMRIVQGAAGDRRQLARERLHQRRLAGAVRAEQAEAITGDRKSTRLHSRHQCAT